ncbi:adhesin [Achromobacter sp. RTa]|uniref:fimbrial protein n=1 Tax=Achromobacter sp. RTa TaxID=1532557 RepID=UPI00050FEF2E|nr:fimbrial protein [Achromobacter sp. RTa]KGD90453.1 adhesin [Achromobacter sp. RTa]
MKKILLGMAILSAFGAASVHAAPTEGAKGYIEFKGSINADTCVMTSSSGNTTNKTLSVDMGEVSASSLGTEANPGSSGTLIGAVAKGLDLEIQCATGTKVTMTLTPSAKSGKGIAVTGGAQNVQVMLVRNDTPLDFATGSVDVLADGPIAGKYSVPLKAYYTLVNTKTVADVVAGTANATVAYTLKYE